MSDEDMLMLSRAAADGDALAASKLERLHSRTGESLRWWLEQLIGKLLFIEGIRINYRGVLKRIIWGGDGKPEGLIFDRLERVSYMERTRPNPNTTFVHQKERFVPWDVVHDIGEECIEGWTR